MNVSEMPHPTTGLPMRMYDTRSFDRVAQVQHSINELELLDTDGSVQLVHRSEVRYIYKHEMALLLRAAGFARFESYDDFDGRPLTREDDPMIVEAWNECRERTHDRGPGSVRPDTQPKVLQIQVFQRDAIASVEPHPAVGGASPEVLPDERAARRRLQELLEGGRAVFVEELHEHHYLPGRLARRLRRLARVVRGQSRRHVGGAADVLSVRFFQAAEDVDTTSRRVVMRHGPLHCTKVAGPRVFDTGAKRVGSRGGLRELRAGPAAGVAAAAIHDHGAQTFC